jgi:hypothetical protein
MSTKAERDREHRRLWQLCPQMTQDYAPWGLVPDSERGFDCSCGCRFYRPLEGDMGGDWGVCTNLKSHRRGLLTFEHQGCKEYE